MHYAPPSHPKIARNYRRRPAAGAVRGPNVRCENAIFIDGANLYATTKALGFEIDFKRLLQEFERGATLVRAFYYTAVFEDQEFSALPPLLDWLDYNGYTVVTKLARQFVDATSHCKVKGNMDVELALNAMDLAGISKTWSCSRAMETFSRWSRRCNGEACASPLYRPLRCSLL
jgi:hypothetical protein